MVCSSTIDDYEYLYSIRRGLRFVWSKIETIIAIAAKIKIRGLLSHIRTQLEVLQYLQPNNVQDHQNSLISPPLAMNAASIVRLVQSSKFCS